jgi:hypothetical protein
MTDSKKPDESKKSAAEEKQDELSVEELDKVAGGVVNLGNALKVATVPRINFDPEIPPTGGGPE